MSTDLILWLVATLLAIGGGARAIRWLQPSGDLPGGVVRPFRVDGWPRGVQEEDEVRWRAPTASGRARGSDPDDDRTSGQVPALRVHRVRVGRPIGR
jgi:hypothetical protein